MKQTEEQQIVGKELLKEWLSPQEVNKEYLFSTSTLAKWRMNKINLPFSKTGKFIKYKRSDIETLLKSNKVEVVL